jgi:hypothetical protein
MSGKLALSAGTLFIIGPMLMNCVIRILRLHRAAPAVLVVALAAAPAASQDFYKGMEAYKQADYATALREWEPLAVRGDRVAQYNLGVIYESGLGVPADKSRALFWYRRSAEQGFAQAQNNLGRLFYLGDPVPPDYAKAAAYFRLAAEQGVAFSHFFLGMIYAGGGPGVKADPVQAYKWLSLASELQKSPRYRSDALASRALVAQGMSQSGIATAERLAYDWKERFRQRGDVAR